MGGDVSGIEPRRKRSLLTLADFPPGLAGDRQQLAILSNPLGGNVTWYAGEYIALAAATGYSFADAYALAAYSPEADSESLDRFNVSLGAASGVNAQIAVWKIDLGGSLVDTTLRINIGGSGSYFQSNGDPRTLLAGERLLFTIDHTITVPWLAICGHRTPN